MQTKNGAVAVELPNQIEAPKRTSVPNDFCSAGDEILVEAAKNGEAQAFEVLVERHERKIFFAALRMTRNKEDAEDVVQQSLQKAFTHLNNFVGMSSFSTWLTRIAMNEALMLLRKKRGSREVLLDDLRGNQEDTAAFELPDLAPDPEVTCAQQELAGLIFSAINTLTPGMRTAFQLRELDERSIEETARIMGISVNAVKARLFHGRRKLRGILRQYFRSPWGNARHSSRATGNVGHVSQQRWLGMRVVKKEMKGGHHDDVSVCRCNGDFGISVFQRPRWFYGPEASSLIGVRYGSIPLGKAG